MTHDATRHLGSTYRLQLNGLGFAGATALVPFLDALGVETCYVSPVTRARSGSTHGYDVTDPTALDPALGTPAEFEDLLRELDAHDMGLLVDIVPNHMAASVENPYFADVLRHGQDSEFATWFDIRWDEQDGRILLPVLGDPLPDVIGRGELTIVTESDEPALAYFEHRFPLAEGTVPLGAADIAAVLDRQHYRLADWRVANREINYRRFFDINDLIGVRQESPEVFAATHRLVLELLRDKRVRGVRVDHIDGLRDPDGYLAMLRDATSESRPQPVVLVEKILESNESLPADWPVQGTTGYEFAAAVIGLFVDGRGLETLADSAATATGDRRSFAERAIAAKRRAVETLLPHQRDQLAVELAQVIGGRSPDDLATAVAELTAALAVYRTYRRAGWPARPEDLDRIRVAAARSRRDPSGLRTVALMEVAQVFSGDLPAGSAAWDAVGAWQQFSGPAAAKGVEDTALYDSGRLLAVADVGSDPDHAARTPAAFHAEMTRRCQATPLAMSSTSTHDSKRSHDVRCRLGVLSEVADEWEATVVALDRAVVGAPDAVPDAADRRYLYQTLVGVWPLDGKADDAFATRVQHHVVKAAREAKRHSSWLEPDSEYEAAFQELAGRIVTGDLQQARDLIEATVATIECAGATNSLASVVLKGTAPGVPDCYQGDDSWAFTLVDPDNRAPLDAAAHQELLSAAPDGLLEQWRDGRVKQTVLRRVLELRRRLPALFAAGDYREAAVTGALTEHVVAFARTYGDRWVLSVVPRLTQHLTPAGQFPIRREAWADTEVVLPAGLTGPAREVLTGRDVSPVDGRVSLTRLLSTLPVAVIEGGAR